MAQLHKKFTDSQVKELMERYLRKEVKRTYLQEILGIKKRRFCTLVRRYRQNPDKFSIQYKRKKNPRTLDQKTENNILKELKFEQNLLKIKTFLLNPTITALSNNIWKPGLNKKYFYLLLLTVPNNMVFI